VQDLENYLVSIAPQEPHHYIDDEISDMPERLFASEITREKLMLNLKQELPYSFKVEVEKWEETPKQLKIYQVIFVGNDNHKKIILGSNGEMIKTIGIQSRLELEAIFEKKVSLFLHLKVRPKELEG
jgi:GTP-binding protein Era